MAEMIPTEIPIDARQEEKTIFKTLADSRLAQDRDWVIFHSIETIGLIDFVIFIPNQLCVICIVVRKPAIPFPWRDRTISYLNSAKEITENMRELYSSTYFCDDSQLKLGYAVVSPDLDTKELKIIIPDPNSDFVSKPLSDLDTTLQDYAANLNPIWENVGYFPPEEGEIVGKEWTQKDFDKFYNDFNNAQFELLVSLRSELEPNYIDTTTIFRDDPETLRSQLLRLTEDQVSSYEKFLENPRCVIDGAAGTGKTVLAKELAKQRCEKGETVMMLCSNRYLSDNFEKWASAVSKNSKGRIIVGTPATLPGKIFEEDSIYFTERHKERYEGQPKLEQTLRLGFLNHGWEQFIEDTVEDLTQVIDNTDPDPEKRGIFDYLIVDEAQNLCDEIFLELMDILLKQGLAKGRWSMFGDFVYQDIVIFDRNVPDVLQVLKNFGEGLDWEYEKLKTNCRNTQQISDAVNQLVPVEALPRSGVHGPHVQIKFFDSLDELNKMLKDLISTYHNKDRQPKECILLSSGADKVFETIVREYGGEYSGWKLMPFREGTEDSSSESDILMYSDVYDYQGLESNLVILVMPKPRTGEQVELSGGDVILTQTDHLMRVLYTGMSRAHTMLIILAQESSYKEIFEVSWPGYGWNDQL